MSFYFLALYLYVTHTTGMPQIETEGTTFILTKFGRVLKKYWE